MSTKTLLKKMSEWLVVVYDKPNTSRAAVRAEHLAGIKPNVEKGIIKSVGPIFHKTPDQPGGPVFAGSTFNLNASSKEEIIEFLKQDVYAKTGIWDLENVILYPRGEEIVIQLIGR